MSEQWDLLTKHRDLFQEWQNIVAVQYQWDCMKGCTCPFPVPQMTNAGTDWVSFGVELTTDPACPLHGWDET